jgi:hypothetical protein
MPVTKVEIFEVRSDLIKWIANKPIKVRKQAKLVILSLAIASREANPARPSVVDLLAEQVQDLLGLAAEKRWRHRR